MRLLITLMKCQYVKWRSSGVQYKVSPSFRYGAYFSTIRFIMKWIMSSWQRFLFGFEVLMLYLISWMVLVRCSKCARIIFRVIRRIIGWFSFSVGQRWTWTLFCPVSILTFDFHRIWPVRWGRMNNFIMTSRISGRAWWISRTRRIPWITWRSWTVGPTSIWRPTIRRWRRLHFLELFHRQRQNLEDLTFK